MKVLRGDTPADVFGVVALKPLVALRITESPYATRLASSAASEAVDRSDADGPTPGAGSALAADVASAERFNAASNAWRLGSGGDAAIIGVLPAEG
jgi:hypothetical protein